MRRQLLSAALLVLLTALPAFARGRHGNNDRAGIGTDITINEGDNVGDIACIFCAVRIHGDVGGDVAVLFGSVSVDSGHKIGGDVAILGGDLNLGAGAETGGDVAILAGDANLANGAAIHGSRTVLPGAFWLLIPFAPLLILIGIIWLIVYLIRRNRYQFPVYPQGRGIQPPRR
ncbi:hypothetical protein [Edaphobacter bradus]|uniref:hypothetical protein n=1 Tax=Edaphobacter bradus TaxID=2259016 RepID=UPI0021E00050|nr:hypothetical protein [Edaphobacter bradus]